MYKKNIVIVFAVLFSMCGINDGICGAGFKTPAEQLSGFDHLLRLASSETAAFDPEKISGILHHVSSDTYKKQPQLKDDLGISTSAYYGFDVAAGMDKILKYCYNKDIPSCAVMPSVIRLSSWKDFDGNAEYKLPDLWKELDTLEQPVVIRGSYYMQNTPDIHTGAYYGYDSYRTVVLFRYKGRNTLISVLKQKDVSDVGKKGFILGEDHNWAYLYSGEKGLNKTGLGWIKSYVYDSFSVSVYIEDENKTSVKCGSFKWLKAGWAGKDVIRKKHILKGLERFSSVFKEVLESKDLPEYHMLAGIWKQYETLSQADKKKKMDQYLTELQNKYGCSSGLPKFLRGRFDKEKFISQMTGIEISSALIVDHISHLIGNNQHSSGSLAYNKNSKEQPVF